MQNKWIFYLFGFLLIHETTSLSVQAKTIDFIKMIVNGEIATNNELKIAKSFWKNRIESSNLPTEEKQKQLKQLQSQIENQMIDELLLIDRSKKIGILVSDEEIENRIDTLQKQNPQWVETYTENTLKETVWREIIKQRVIAREVDSFIRIENQEIVQYCKANLKNKRELGVSQILFRKTEQEALQLQQQIEAEMKAGKTFKELAAQYSDDPNSQTTGGKLGNFQKGQLLPEIDTVIFQMSLNEMSSLVKTTYGYHLLFIDEERMIEDMDCLQMTPEDKENVTNQIYTEKRKNKLKEYLANLKEKAKIMIYSG